MWEDCKSIKDCKFKKDCYQKEVYKISAVLKNVGMKSDKELTIRDQLGVDRMYKELNY